MSYIFLDESGTHKNTGNTSVVLVFVTSTNLETLNSGVIEIENQLGIKYFHWTEYSWKFKEKFLRGITHLPFSLKVLVFKNPFSWDHYEKALRYAGIDDGMDVLIVDGKKPRHFRKEYKKILRSHGIVLKKLVLGNDRAYPALRIADFVAGLMRSYSENPSQLKVKKMHDLLRSKIIFVFYE